MPNESIDNESEEIQLEDQAGVITESGILFENGELLSDREVAKIAIEAKHLLESGDERAFAELIYGSRVKSLSKEDQRILLWNSAITDIGHTIMEKLMFID